MNIDELREKFNKDMAIKKAKDEELLNKMNDDMIRFEDCKPGYTYDIDARNFRFAIFYKDEFYGIRYKFGNRFIDNEVHWDKDEHYGTVRPKIEIEKTPDYVIEALENDNKTTFEIVKKYLDVFAFPDIKV